MPPLTYKVERCSHVVHALTRALRDADIPGKVTKVDGQSCITVELDRIDAQRLADLLNDKDTAP